ncbi:EpsG family protein [Paratractidigestivibacter sp.]|uniref:EpsG family protein n=1 Tax=Paratractidigestivibacter sp. TaxID=2847316 RepID=UPI002AC8E041|nr:EpsG family protein [Paratractidigestivibacter sp.]
MAEYFAVGIITACMAYLTTQFRGKIRYLFLGLSGVPSAWLAAVRYGIGPDFSLYVRIFDMINLTGRFFSVKELEPGYTALNRLVLLFTDDYKVLFFIVAWLISSFFFLGFLKISKKYVFSVVSFFSMGFYCDSLNGLRQYIAAAITFYSLSCLVKGERGRAIALCLVAMLFHQSALIMLIVCLAVDKFSLNSWKAIALVAALLLGGNLIYDFVTGLISSTRYSYYLGSVEYVVEPTLGTTVLTSASVIVAVALGVYKESDDSRESRVFKNMGLLALISALLSFFVPLALRVQYYFVPFEMVFLPYAISNLKNRNAAFLLGAGLFLTFLGMNVVGMVFNGWYGAYPYQMV